jgi:hypothetical protein
MADDGLSYVQTVALATIAARHNVERELRGMFVEPAAAAERVAQHEKAKTQEWHRAYQAMFDAINSLEAIGCKIIVPEGLLHG